MKSKVIALSIVAVMSVSGLAFAEEMAAQEAAVSAAPVEQVAEAAAPIQVGNKVCPVSGKAIKAEDFGKNTVEYKGKIYNLCCPMCKEKFLADADKFSMIAEAEVAAVEQAPAEAPVADMPPMK